MASISIDTRTIHRGNFDHPYTEDVFVNPDSFPVSTITSGIDSRMDRAFVIHNAGYVKAIVFAEYYAYSEQDAMDEAADSGKLDYLKVTEAELADYQVGTDGEGNPEYEGIIHLGNASEPFDSENLDLFVVPASLFESDPVIAPVVGAAMLDRVWEYVEGERCRALYMDSTYTKTREDFDEVQYDGFKLAADLIRARQRLEYLRGELRAERISYDELAELQGLASHIDPIDVELLEAAGVPERVWCSVCAGTGHTCGDCGEVEGDCKCGQNSDAIGYDHYRRVECAECDGTGWRDKE